MSSVLKVHVHKASVDVSGQKMPCWQVDVTKATRERLVTTTTTMPVRQFYVNDPDPIQIQARLDAANAFAAQLGEIIGANLVTLGGPE